ncbi:hypothetical protein FRC04_008554 [Tulasnella sp. 424]|nr:hypothetical protein FRC04_008554 [Tulasnella sp. 424]KAG8974024.1 hypothetical protein FRC05_007940 [Tulasnella sp. 425]
MSFLESCLRRRQKSASPTKSLQDLPVEIVLNVLEAADSISTLHSASAVSRHLHDVANSLLYRHIEVHHVHRAVFLLSTLLDNPELGRYIKSFDCSVLPSRCRLADFVATSFDLRTNELVVRALRKAVGLTSLVVSVNVCDLGAGGWVTLLRGPIELRKLVLCGRTLSYYAEDAVPSTRQDWAKMIADVLKAQPSITELEIMGVELHAVPRLGPTDLPNLRKITASSAVALQLVLGGGSRSPRSVTLGDDITIQQVQDTVFDLVPDGAAVEEFTWQGPMTKRLSVGGWDHADVLAFLSQVAVKFPHVRSTTLPMSKGSWQRKDEYSVEWVRVLREVAVEEDDEEDGGMFENDLNPLGVTHRCYP